MAVEYDVDCGCGLGRIYQTRGMAQAMRLRFSSQHAEAADFRHRGCGGKLVLTGHPEGTISEEHGRSLIVATAENLRADGML